MRELLITSGGCWCMIWNLCFNYTLGIVEIDVSTTLNAIPLPLAVLHSHVFNTEGLWKVVCCKCNSIVSPVMAELPMGFTSLASCSRTGRCCVWTWSFTVFLEEWSQEIFHGHCCASVVRLAWKALFVFASVFINKALHHLFNIQTCPFFHPLPTFHLAELQEHAWWLWQSFIHVKITNYLLVIWFLVESAVFQGGSGRQY